MATQEIRTSSANQGRWRQAAGRFIFGAGISTIILLEVGACALRRDSIGVFAPVQDSTLETPIRITGANKEYVAEITYTLGRKGEYARLRIFQKSGDERRPITFQLAKGLDPKRFIDYFPPQTYFDSDATSITTQIARRKNSESLTVAESELFSSLSPAHLYPVNWDEDRELEFFLHQDAEVNGRAMPLAPGSYIVDYDVASDEWIVHECAGLRSFLMVAGWPLFGAQCLIYLLCACANTLIRRQARPNPLFVIANFIAVFGSLKYYYVSGPVLLAMAAWHIRQYLKVARGAIHLISRGRR